MNKFKLAIVGASGLVGQTILKVLEEENLINKFDIILIASDQSAGKSVRIQNKKYTYKSLNKDCLNLGINFVIFSAGDDISKKWAKKFAKNGTYVIDNSNAFRKNKEVPLVVPEINGTLINENSMIIANPNCSTIQLAIVLARFYSIFKIKKVIVSSYQSVSGAGKDAIDDLKNDTNKVFSCKIKNNIIPVIGDIDESGFCKEENKIMFELKKILNEKFSILATTVRVPVELCHGESVYVKFSQNIDKKAIKNALKCNFISFSNEIYHNYECKNTNLTYVCRLRQPSKNELMMFIFADNLRRGAAYNAVLILKYLLNILK